MKWIFAFVTRVACGLPIQNSVHFDCRREWRRDSDAAEQEFINSNRKFNYTLLRLSSALQLMCRELASARTSIIICMNECISVYFSWDVFQFSRDLYSLHAANALLLTASICNVLVALLESNEMAMSNWGLRNNGTTDFMKCPPQIPHLHCEHTNEAVALYFLSGSCSLPRIARQRAFLTRGCRVT